MFFHHANFPKGMSDFTAGSNPVVLGSGWDRQWFYGRQFIKIGLCLVAAINRLIEPGVISGTMFIMGCNWAFDFSELDFCPVINLNEAVSSNFIR